MADTGITTLMTGAGAVEGLQELLRQRMLEREMALHERTAQQNAEFQRQQLAEQMELRKAQQDWNRQYQTEMLTERKAALAEKKQTAAENAHLRKIALTPIGTTFPSTDPTIAEAGAFGTEQLFRPIPVSAAGQIGQIGAGPMQESEQGELPSRPISNEPETQQYEFQGTQAAQQAEATLGATMAAREAADADRDASRAALIDQREWLRANRPEPVVVIQTTDEGGRPVTRVVPRSEASGQSYGAGPTADMRNRQVAFQKATPVLNAVSELSEKINQGQGVVAKLAGGAKRAAAKANLDDDVAEYEALVSGFTPLIARAVGHVGVLTELDVQSVRQMFPRPGDSKSLRDRKVKRLMSLMQDIGTNATGGAGPTRKRYDVDGNPIPE